MLAKLLALPIDGELAIVTHDNPDPDSLASAAALKYLLEQTRSVRSTIIYSGIIGRAENRAMVRILELPLRRYAEIDLNRFSHVALIDAQPGTGNTALGERIPDIVIDHHPLRKSTTAAAFYDVRETLGASATLMTGYLRESRASIPPDLATALLYGIRSETQDLGREAADEDRDAYQFLFPIADHAKLAAISRPELPRSYFRELARALGGFRFGHHCVVVSLGEVIDPDFVPEMADLAVRTEGIVWSLAYGTFASKLHVSIRTNDEDADAGALIQRILHGIGRGGGHGMRGGGNVPLDSSDFSATEKEIERRFLEATGNGGEELKGLNE